MSSFVGNWSTTRYTANDPSNPENIIVQITQDADPTVHDGSYPRPGPDARLFGSLDASGIVWTAQIDEQGSSGDQGTAVFFLSTDGNTLYGAWQSQQHNSGPQPWFGTRI
jgi:hypothetical protein